MRLFHYRGSSESFQLYHVVQPLQHFKPKGLWLTADDEYNWEWWCKAEEFNLEDLKYRFIVNLHEHANLKIISNIDQLDRFEREFQLPEVNTFGSIYAIDWRQVAEQFDGIVIVPYLWDRRLSTMWYYSWDCSSACIWNPSVIQSISLDPTYSYVPRLTDE